MCICDASSSGAWSCYGGGLYGDGADFDLSLGRSWKLLCTMRVHVLAVDPLIRELTLEILADMRISPPQEPPAFPSPEPEEVDAVVLLPLPPTPPPVLVPICDTPPESPAVPLNVEMPVLRPFEDDGNHDLRVSPPMFDMSDSNSSDSDGVVEFDCTHSPSSSPVHSPFHLDFPLIPGQDCASCAHLFERDGEPMCSLCYLRLACSGKRENNMFSCWQFLLC